MPHLSDKYAERTWTMATINSAIKNLMKTYIRYPPRKLQSEGYRRELGDGGLVAGEHGGKGLRGLPLRMLRR